MDLSNELSRQLKSLGGSSGTAPQTVTLTGPDAVEVDVEFAAVDSMSCAVREIRLRVPSLVDAGADVLERWADAISQRVTYLLEGVGPLEVDEENAQVLVRSTPPDKQADGTTFYEIFLASQSNGNFSLRRYRAQKGTPGRDQVDIQLTHQVLTRLVDDLVDTIPA